MLVYLLTKSNQCWCCPLAWSVEIIVFFKKFNVIWNSNFNSCWNNWTMKGSFWYFKYRHQKTRIIYYGSIKQNMFTTFYFAVVKFLMLNKTVVSLLAQVVNFLCAGCSFSIGPIKVKTFTESWIYCLKIQGAISKNADPIPGLFVLISMHFPCWIQIW